MVLIIFCILSILGISLYSLAIVNQKIEIMNIQMKKNFYFAEAGIEEAYGIMTNEIDTAIEKGNKAAKCYLEDINLEEERSKSNSPFFQENDINNDDIIDNRTINYDYIKEKLEIVFREGYHDGENKYIGYDKYIEENLVNKVKNIENYNANENGIYNIKAEYDIDNKIVSIESSFTKNRNQRRVKAKYELKNPEFNQMYYYESNKVDIVNDILLSNTLSAGEDLIINSSKIDVIGNMYIGNDILVNSENNIIMNEGNILSNNFTINNNSSDNNISINNLYVKDDLNIKGKDINMDIDEYYGYGYGDIPSKSSAIIINSLEDEDNISLNISDKLTILGTVFIDTEQPYQTGESISIKKNYKAYSQEYLTGEYSVSYYNPLILVSDFTDVYSKAKYFSDVVNKNKNDFNLGKSINIPNNSTSLGILLDEGNIKYDINSNIDQEKVILDNDLLELKGWLEQGVTKYLNLKDDFLNADFYEDEMIYRKNEIIKTTIKNIQIERNSDGEMIEGIYITSGDVNLKGELDFKGLIIAGGNISIEGNVNITGSIISGNKIFFNNDSDVKIKEDKKYLFQLLAKNGLLTNKLFTYEENEKIPVLASEELILEEGKTYQNMSKFIELKEWELVK